MYLEKTLFLVYDYLLNIYYTVHDSTFHNVFSTALTVRSTSDTAKYSKAGKY